MDLLLRTRSCLRRAHPTALTTSRPRRLLSSSRAPQAIASSIRDALANSTFFSDNSRWQGMVDVMGGHGGHGEASEGEVALESRLESVRPRGNERLPSRPTGPLPPAASPSPLPLDTYKAYPPLTVSRLLRIYSQLSKARLTTLIVLTAMSGVALSPLPATVPVLLSTALGTFLCSASANTFNQLSESPFDAQQPRTRNRPLPRRAISPSHAFAFGTVSGLAGIGVLLAAVNPLTAALGAFNIWLYAGAYTPLKRTHPVNTWVGAVVGAIPPVMGWTACGGHLLPSAAHPITLHLPEFLATLTAPTAGAVLPAAADNLIPLSTAATAAADTAADNPLAALALFALLFSWQFPHFNPLAHLTRAGYAQAGYQMLSVTDARHNAQVALRHAVILLPICSLLIPVAGLTSWAFALSSLVPNAMCVRAAWAWWAVVESGRPSEREARRLWGVCLWYLPVMLGLMMLHKRDSWWGRMIEGGGMGDAEELVGAEAKLGQTMTPVAA